MMAEMQDSALVPIAPLVPDLTVAEMLNRWRETASVFIARRMACVGCPLSSFETLDNVAAVYGLPLETLLGDFEKAIASDGGNK